MSTGEKSLATVRDELRVEWYRSPVAPAKLRELDEAQRPAGMVAVCRAPDKIEQSIGDLARSGLTS